MAVSPITFFRLLHSPEFFCSILRRVHWWSSRYFSSAYAGRIFWCSVSFLFIFFLLRFCLFAYRNTEAICHSIQCKIDRIHAIFLLRFIAECRSRSSWTQFSPILRRMTISLWMWAAGVRRNGSRCSKYSHCVFLLFAIYLRWNINEAPPTSLQPLPYRFAFNVSLFLFVFFLFEINDPIKRRLHEIGCFLYAIIIWLFTCRNLWGFCKALDTVCRTHCSASFNSHQIFSVCVKSHSTVCDVSLPPAQRYYLRFCVHMKSNSKWIFRPTDFSIIFAIRY